MSTRVSPLQACTVRALDRVLAENRQLRERLDDALRDRARRVVGRHCGYCGMRVCGCGLEGWEE